MPYTSLSKAKKAGAITTYLNKPLSLAAVNKLYDIYDGIKAGSKKVKNPMAVAMSTWKGNIELKNGVWLLKPKKECITPTKKKRIKESLGVGGYPVSTTGVKGFSMPAGSGKIGDGSMESFRNALRDALLALFDKQYLYIIATYKTKVYVDVDEGKKAGYYEIPYSIKDGAFIFGTAVKVMKLTKFQKAEQKIWRDYRESVKKFVRGSMRLGEVVKLGIKVSREKV